MPLGTAVPEGYDTVINHIRATDIVGLANTQYGGVREYAMAEDLRFTLMSTVIGNSRVGNVTLIDGSVPWLRGHDDGEWWEVA